MKLSELKAEITAKTLDEQFLIFECPDNFFIAEQYINQICQNKGIDKQFCTSLAQAEECKNAFLTPEVLYIIKCDVFKELFYDYTVCENIIVLCNSIDKKLRPGLTDYIITFTKPLDWQVLEYIKIKCPVISEANAQWLFEAANQNLYKIETELDKICLFAPGEQKEILEAIKYCPDSDLFMVSAFAFAEALIKRDMDTLNNIVHHLRYIDIDPLALVSIMLATFKKILWVNYGSSQDLESLGISGKQINAVRYYYPPRICSQARAIEAIQFLSGIDLALKQGKLDTSKDNLLTYIIFNMLCGFNK